jgi:hypothetical protein
VLWQSTEGRKPGPKLTVGDLVMLSGKNIKTRRLLKKFDVKMHGLFEVIKVVSLTAYRLKLLKN